MKRNDIFTFTAPNGVEVTAVVVKEFSYRVMAGDATTQYLCYSQNRLFTYEKIEDVWHKERPINYKYGEVLVDYCILPDYDDMLEAYSDHLVTVAEEQSGMAEPLKASEALQNGDIKE